MLGAISWINHMHVHTYTTRPCRSVAARVVSGTPTSDTTLFWASVTYNPLESVTEQIWASPIVVRTFERELSRSMDVCDRMSLIHRSIERYAYLCVIVASTGEVVYQRSFCDCTVIQTPTGAPESAIDVGIDLDIQQLHSAHKRV